MRKIILGLLLSICSVFHAEAQAPDWVTQRPTSSDAYIGIGVASLSETDYMKKATQNALLDIVSQIAVKLENNSFLHRVDVDGKTREMLEDKIHSSMVAWLTSRNKNITCITPWIKKYMPEKPKNADNKRSGQAWITCKKDVERKAP